MSEEKEREPSPRWLDGADDLAAMLLERASPIRFDVAGTPEELDAVFRLRARISIERGWRRPEELPDGVERDGYDDEHAAQIAGWDGAVLAATARVVYPLAGRPLPTEEAFGIDAQPAGEVVDAGRLIVAPEYRDPERRVLGGLAASIWTAMSRRGYRWAAVAMTPAIVELCRALGFDVRILAEPRAYWGEERVPALLSAPDPRAWSRPGATR